MLSEKGPLLYHGSSRSGIPVLEPRQAINDTDLDGAPAVFATSDIDYAIFMALIGSNSWGGWDSDKYPGRGFYLHEEFLDYLTSSTYEDIEGCVYFLPRHAFSEFRGNEYRSPTVVRPLGMMAVSVTDLPHDITITSELHPYHLRKGVQGVDY